jgi:hypothetical protein
VVALAVTTAAWAWFASTGSGSGAGAAAASQTLTISGGTTTQTLIPTGAASGDVTVTLTNSTANTLHVNSLVLDTARGNGGYSATDSPSAATCGVTYAAQSNGGAGWNVAPNATSTIDLTSSVTMASSAPNTCQGKSFTIYLKAA